MADPKTQVTDVNPADFCATLDPKRCAEGIELLKLFQSTTGWQPRMWGPSIIGFGAYDYTYATGHSGRAMATGFSPRKANISIYVMPGYQDFGPILDRLGPHKMGKSCLYITRLQRVDTDVLMELVQAGIEKLGKLYPITPDPA